MTIENGFFSFCVESMYYHSGQVDVYDYIYYCNWLLFKEVFMGSLLDGVM